MAKRRHIGFVIFALCSALSARIALFEPKPPQVPTPAEERWGTANRDEGDPLHFIRAVRYYVYGLGVVGLLMVVEDIVSERLRKRKKRVTHSGGCQLVIKFSLPIFYSSSTVSTRPSLFNPRTCHPTCHWQAGLNHCNSATSNVTRYFYLPPPCI